MTVIPACLPAGLESSIYALSPAPGLLLHSRKGAFMNLFAYVMKKHCRHSREGGNPGAFVLNDNGFPITTSGMTVKVFELM